MKLVKTSLFSAVITLVKIGSGFIANKAVAIIVGASGIAALGQFTNFISIALTFANGAINNGVVKYTAEYEDDEVSTRRLFSTSLKLSVICSVAIGFTLLIFASLISDFLFQDLIYKNPVRVLGVTIIFYSLNSLLISILNGKKEIKAYTLVNTVGSIIGLLFTVILVYYFKLTGALYALVLTQSVVFFVTLAMVIKSKWFLFSYFNDKFDKQTAYKLGQFSLMAIATILTVPISQIFLRNILIQKLGIESAGYWQGMMRISDGYLLLATTSLGTYYLPKLSGLQSSRELKNEIFNGYKIILPAVFVSCFIIFFLRDFIINLLYTPSFREMRILFFYQLLGDFFKIASWILGYLIVAKAMTKTYIILELSFTISYIILSLISINIFGLQGISIAFAINYFFYFILMIIIFRKLLFSQINS